MPTHLPRAGEINSSGEQRIADIWRFQPQRTLQASTFLSDTVLKQLALEGQLVAFSVGSALKRWQNGAFVFQNVELRKEAD